MVGGRQLVSLGFGCVYKGIVMHELLHAAGFWHEQSRQDRDNYVQIIRDNIQDGMGFNFNSFRTDYLGAAYDTGESFSIT